MATPPHGTPRSYRRGCRCATCREAQRVYSRDKRLARAGLPCPDVQSIRPDGLVVRRPGPVETGVLEEIAALSTANARPGLVQVALAHARVMDDPGAVSQHASNGHRLAEALDKMRRGADSQVGRLATVRKISSVRSA
jgi:hypothetical protein